MRAIVSCIVVIAACPCLCLADVPRWELTGPDHGPAEVIRVHPVDANVLYAGTRLGVYVSTDFGETWAPTSDELRVAISSLELEPGSPDTLFVLPDGTEGCVPLSEDALGYPIEPGVVGKRQRLERLSVAPLSQNHQFLVHRPTSRGCRVGLDPST